MPCLFIQLHLNTLLVASHSNQITTSTDITSTVTGIPGFQSIPGHDTHCNSTQPRAQDEQRSKLIDTGSARQNHKALQQPTEIWNRKRQTCLDCRIVDRVEVSCSQKMRRMTLVCRIGIAPEFFFPPRRRTSKEWFQSANFQRPTYRKDCPTNPCESEVCAFRRRLGGVQTKLQLVTKSCGASTVHDVFSCVVILQLLEHYSSLANRTLDNFLGKDQPDMT